MEDNLITRSNMDDEFSKNTVDTKDFLDLIFEMIEEITSTDLLDEQEVIFNESKKKLESYEIVTGNSSNGKKFWMSLSPSWVKVITPFTLKDKIIRLFKYWYWSKPGDSYNLTLEMVGAIESPFTYAVTEEELGLSDNKEISKFVFSLFYLVYKINTIQKTIISEDDIKAENLGIYKKPYGVIASNSLRSWLGKNEMNSGEIDIEGFISTIEVLSVSEMLSNSNVLNIEDTNDPDIEYLTFNTKE